MLLKSWAENICRFAPASASYRVRAADETLSYRLDKAA
jgi:hypothetical protein